MPPLFDYRCKKCQATCEVLRPLADSDLVPTSEEFPPTEECAHDDVQKYHRGAPTVVKAPYWGKKGHW